MQRRQSIHLKGMDIAQHSSAEALNNSYKEHAQKERWKSSTHIASFEFGLQIIMQCPTLFTYNTLCLAHFSIPTGA